MTTLRCFGSSGALRHYVENWGRDGLSVGTVRQN